jgi:hypothetical protein
MLESYRNMSELHREEMFPSIQAFVEQSGNERQLRRDPILITIEHTLAPIGESTKTVFDHVLTNSTGLFPKWYQPKTRFHGSTLSTLSDVAIFAHSIVADHVMASYEEAFPSYAIQRYGLVSALALNDLWHHRGDINEARVKQNQEIISFSTDKRNELGDICCLLTLSYEDVLSVWGVSEEDSDTFPWILLRDEVKLFNSSLRTHFEILRAKYPHTIVIDTESTENNLPISTIQTLLVEQILDKLKLVYEQAWIDFSSLNDNSGE